MNENPIFDGVQFDPDFLVALKNFIQKYYFPVTETNISLSDVTTDNVSTSKHGFAPKITDTTKFLKGDGTWATPSGGTPGGSNTQVQFNDSGTFGGDSELSYNKTTHVLTAKEIDSFDATSGLTLDAINQPNATGNGGSVSINAGTGGATSGTGGTVFIGGGTGGGTSGAGGSTQMLSGSANGGNSAGGRTDLTAGNGSGSGAGGVAAVSSGNGGHTGNAGGVFLSGGSGGVTSGTGGFIELDAGNAIGGTSSGGYIQLNTGLGHGGGASGFFQVSVGGSNFIYSGEDLPTYATTMTLDVNKQSLHLIATDDPTGNTTINASSGGTAGQVIFILIANDATSGKTITFGTNFKSSGTLTGTISETASIAFISNGASFYELCRTTGL